MSRARNLKPGFFKNDLLAECDPLARILFQGLWCEADREGRLEDRPKRLKAECLPYDDCDIDALLSQLEQRGFIARYVVDGERFIAVIAFAKHQNPHIKEHASTIPAPDKSGASSEQARLIPSSSFPLIDSPSPLQHEEAKDEPSAVGAGDFAIPLKDGTDFLPPVDLLASLRQAYPRVDLAAEIRKARAWCVANPDQQKTRKGAGKFLNGWIGRAAAKIPVDRPPPPAAGGRTKLA